MKAKSLFCRSKTLRAFTLIELLVVIAIIAVLAALIFPVTGAVNRLKVRKKAEGDLRLIEAAIENYKSQLGHYPQGTPDLTVPYCFTTLYYELAGTRLINPTTYETLDGVSTIDRTVLQNTFGVGMLVNSMQGQGDDERRKAQRFTTAIKSQNVAPLIAGNENAPKILVSTVGWKNLANPILAQNPGANPFFYNALNPTNNPNSYDLWVDVIVGSKTNRISNWNREAIVLP